MKPTKPKSVPLTERAVFQRVNRRLEKEGAKLMKARGESYGTVGKFYVVDRRKNMVTETHVNLGRYARKIGAIEKWEELLDEQES
jgi:hypothetical protein